jgi:hypothetical protein
MNSSLARTLSNVNLNAPSQFWSASHVFMGMRLVDRWIGGSAAEKAVILYLIRCCNKLGAAWPCLNTIATAVGFCERTVRCSLRTLETSPDCPILVARETHTGRSSTYRLTIREDLLPATPEPVAPTPAPAAPLSNSRETHTKAAHAREPTAPLPDPGPAPEPCRPVRVAARDPIALDQLERLMASLGAPATAAPSTAPPAATKDGWWCSCKRHWGNNTDRCPHCGQVRGAAPTVPKNFAERAPVHAEMLVQNSSQASTAPDDRKSRTQAASLAGMSHPTYSEALAVQNSAPQDALKSRAQAASLAKTLPQNSSEAPALPAARESRALATVIPLEPACTRPPERGRPGAVIPMRRGEP